MATATMFEFEYGGAQIKLPPHLIVQNFLDSLQQPTVELAALATDKTKPPAVGEYWKQAGGIYAGIVRGEKGATDHHLIVAAGPDGFSREITFGGRGQSIEGAVSDLDGYANTLALASSAHDHPAAEWASSLTIEGHDDWYLAARRELRLCWVNVPELFEDGWYWSSTQFSADSAWCQTFGGGGQGINDKDYKLRARAVRRLSVIR
jgi:hypothetical protein